MRLTQWTDYTLRVLMYCAATEGRAQPVTITEVAEGYGISRSHLMKIVQQLSAQGLLETMRGRGGRTRPAAHGGTAPKQRRCAQERMGGRVAIQGRKY